MPRGITRRGVLAGTATAAATIALGGRTVQAAPSTDRYLVDLRSDDVSLDGLELTHRLDEIGVAVVRGSEEAVAGLRYSRDVALSVSPPEIERGCDDDDDHDGASEPLYYLQWDKGAQAVPGVHPEVAGRGTNVAVIDSGVYDDHPDLAHAIDSDLSRNFTGDGGDYRPNGAGDHGTHVAGIVAANAGNDRGVLGTAPETDIVACRVFSAGGGATFGDIIAAMVYAAAVGCDVANMSLGAYPVPLSDPETRLLIDVIERAASFANEEGTLIVASAGNAGENLDDDGDVISLPNEAANVMSISATGPIGFRWSEEDDGGDDEDGDDSESETRDGDAERGDDDDDADRPEMKDALEATREPPRTPAFYTNYGTDAVDVSAPGGNADRDAMGTDANWQYDLVLSTAFTVEDDDVTPGYGWKAGTSMASPQVAAVAALVRGIAPQASATEVRHLIEQTARDVSPADYRGEGHLDTTAAVEAAEELRRGDDEEDSDDEHSDDDYGNDEHGEHGDGH
ncbi:S8 family peptidase [Haloarchaeobius sp. DFWS5]|uniref:S8 family peptidase n=1 Tax=Haloarchaeobius sp. DFWS5 TaxID=3446114 RepID=UPI003EBE9C62